jgi:hypothetical protein
MSLFDQISSPYGVGAAPFRPPVVTQPNDTSQSAMSRGGLSANQVVTGPTQVGLNAGANQYGATAPTLLATMSDCGSNGTLSNAANPNYNMGAPSNGPAGNVMNGANPGATTELMDNIPASNAVSGLVAPAAVAPIGLTVAAGVLGG